MGELLEALWYARPTARVMLLRTVLAPLLFPLTLIFDALTGLRRSAYRSGGLPVYQVGCPVVVVGNLSVGGTGKTPLVIALARALTAAGCEVGVVTRGYGGRVRGVREVTAESDPREVGDEACLLAKETAARVVVSADRGEAAMALEQAGVDVILSDDGLQHYGLARDLEIVVVDEARGLGNGWLLPAGPLREGRGRLHAVDWLVLHEAASVAGAWRGSEERGLQRRVGEAVGLVLGDTPRLLGMRLAADTAFSLQGERSQRLADFSLGPVHAVAGIGRPERFFSMLQAAGLQVIPHPFPDHHAFTAADIPAEWQGAVLMTSKDAVKCQAFADERMWVVPVSAQLAPAGAEALQTQILDLCRQRSRPGSPPQPRSRADG